MNHMKTSKTGNAQSMSVKFRRSLKVLNIQVAP